MRIVADLHIHSKYSRAVSRDMTLANLNIWAKKKGVHVLGTGDFTHPAWFRAITQELKEREPGLFTLKTDKTEKATRFMLTVEIANIYSKAGRTRRVHNLVFAPSLGAASEINKRLSLVGNLAADGRPMLGLDSKELFHIALAADPRCVLVPAYAWTPWFSVFGSMSGFDALEECFEELTPKIFAIETGLSSDPAMNWRLSRLDNIALISNSDSHSLQRIGREANVFDATCSYEGIIGAIRARDPVRFLETIEFFPEEGKYHADGHRDAGHFQMPADTVAAGGKCKTCGRRVVVGVLSRVEALADRARQEASTAGRVPYRSAVPLDEIIAAAVGVSGVRTKAVAVEYEKLIAGIGAELPALLDAPFDALSLHTTPRIAEGILRVRERRVSLRPGYDGEYGKITVFTETETNAAAVTPQANLFS